MSENPLQFLFLNIGKLSNSIQTHLSNLINPSNNPKNPLLSVSSSTETSSNLNATAVPRDRDFLLNKAQTVAPVTKEELGRCTWTFLHTLAAQYPDNPTRQQKRDVKELMAILSRMYPCQECADHFKEVLRTNPVQAGSHADFSQWLCYVHNVVNRRVPIYSISTGHCFEKQNKDAAIRTAAPAKIATSLTGVISVPSMLGLLAGVMTLTNLTFVGTDCVSILAKYTLL